MAVYKENTIFNGPLEAFGSKGNCKIVRQSNGIKERFLAIILNVKDQEEIQYIFTNENGLWVADGSINVELYISLATILDTYKIDK